MLGVTTLDSDYVDQVLAAQKWVDQSQSLHELKVIQFGLTLTFSQTRLMTHLSGPSTTTTGELMTLGDLATGSNVRGCRRIARGRLKAATAKSQCKVSIGKKGH